MSLTMHDRIYSFLGLIQKSGLVSSGDDTVQRDIKKHSCKLLVIADDTSENTRKRFESMAKHHGVEYIYFGNKEDLGHSIGKGERAVISIRDGNLAKGLLTKLNNLNGGESNDNKG